MNSGGSLLTRLKKALAYYPLTFYFGVLLVALTVVFAVLHYSYGLTISFNSLYLWLSDHTGVLLTIASIFLGLTLLSSGLAYRQVSNMSREEYIIWLQQRSTRTLFPFFTPIHDWFRLRFRPYRWWSLQTYSSSVHVMLLVLALLFAVRTVAPKVTVSPLLPCTDTWTITGLPGSVTAGVAQTVTVTLTNTMSEAVDTGYRGTITFTSSDGAATFPSPYTFTGADAGVHTFTSAVTFNTGGSQSVTVTDNALVATCSNPSGSASTTVSAGAADHLTVTGITTPITAGTASNVTVTAKTSGGATATSYVGTVHFTSTDGQAVLPSNYHFVSGDNGVHTFSSGVTLKTSGTQSVTATDTITGTITGTQSSITVNPGSAATLTVTGLTTPVTAGTASNVIVTAKDSFSNTATGYTGIAHFTSTDGQATLPSNYTFVGGDSGVHTFTNGVTLKTAGTKTVTATDTITGSITGTSASITVNPATAATLTVTGISTPVTAGTTSSPVVTALDSFSNTATGYTGTITFTSSDGQATKPSNYTFVGGDNGVHTFTNGFTFKTSGTQTATATDTITGSITGTSASITVNPATAATLTVSGITTPTTAGTARTATVTAKDAFSNTATGYTGIVHFTSTDGAAVLPSNYTFVGGDSGAHTFTNGVTLKTSGTQSVTATDTITGTITGSQTNITVNPATAATLTVTGITSPITAGTASNVVVTAKDSFSNTATGYTGTITFTSSDGQAVLPSNYTFVGGDNGVHTFTNGVTLKTAGSKTVTATDTVTGTITGTSSAITVNVATTSTLTVTGISTPVTAGNTSTPVVTAKDAFGNTTPAYTGTIHFTSTDGQAVLPSNYTFVGGDNGVHTFTNGVTLKTAGTQTVTATDINTGSITGTSANITVNPAAAAQLVVSAPGSATAGSAFSVTVTAKDAFNNTVTSYAGTIQFSSTDGQAVLPSNYTFVGGDNGAHTFTNGVTLKTVGSKNVTVAETSPGTLTTTVSVTVNPAAASTIVFSSTPTTATAGVAFSATLTAQDSFGNTATGYTGTIGFTSNDGQAVLPSNYTFVGGDNGVHTFTNAITLKTSGSKTVTVTDTINGAITATANVTVSAASANSLIYSSVPSTATAGTAFSVTVVAKDAFSNTATGYTGIVHFTSNDGQAVLPSNYTFVGGDNGSHTFTNAITLKTAGSKTLTATDTITGSMHADATISVSAAAASQITMTSASNVATAGAAFTVTVTANDSFSNVATSYTGVVHFTSTDGSATLPSNYTFVGGDNGVHAFTNGVTLVTAGSKSVTVTDLGNGSLTSTLSFTVSAGSVNQLIISGTPSSTTAGSAFGATVTLKDSNGNVATGYTGTVHFSSSDSIAVLPSNYTFVGGDSGVHTFTNAITLKTAGSKSLTITDIGNGSITDSKTITVNPAAASQYIFSSAPSSTTAGTAFGGTLTVEDAFDNLVTGYAGTVHFTSSDSQAVLPGDYTFIPGSDTGVHTFTNAITLKTSGTQTVTLIDAGNFSLTTQISVTVSPNSAAQLIALGPVTVTAGGSFTVSLTVEDAYANIVTNYSGTAHFTSSDAQAVLPADYTFVGGDAGTHSFTNGLTLKTAGNKTVTITTGSLLSELGIVVNPAAASSFTYAVTPVTEQAGNSFAMQAEAIDAYANIVTNYSGTAHFTSSDAQAVLPADYTFISADNGAHTFSFTLKTGGSQTITINDVVSSSITHTVTISVTAGSTAKLGVTLPTTMTAGTAGSVTVTAQDAFGNTTTGYTGTVRFSSSDSQASLPSNYTFVGNDQGAHTFTNQLTLKTAGSISVTAADTVTFSITGSGTTTVNAGTLSRMIITFVGNVTTVVAGTSVTPCATAQDAFGNPVTSFAGLVGFTSSDPQASTPTNYTYQAADKGIKCFTNGFVPRTAGNQTISLKATVIVASGTVQLTATSPTLTVTAGFPSTITIQSSSGSVTAGDVISVAVSLKDSFGNPATYTGTVTFSSSDPSSSLPADYTFTPGDNSSRVFRNSVVLKTAGSQKITVSDTQQSNLSASEGINVSPGPLASYSIKTASPTQTVGVGWKEAVTGQDAYGNTVTNNSITVATPSSTGKAQFYSGSNYSINAASYILTSGALNMFVKDDSAETITLKLQSFGGISGQSKPITVLVAGAGPSEPASPPITTKVSSTVRSFFNQQPVLRQATTIVSGITPLAILLGFTPVGITLATAATAAAAQGSSVFYMLFAGLLPFQSRHKPKWGTLRHALTGLPIAGVFVTLLDQRGHRVNRTLTDKTGRYGFLIDKPGKYQISIDNPLYSKYLSELLTISEPKKQMIVDDIAMMPIDSRLTRRVAGAFNWVRVTRFFARLYWPVLVLGSVLSGILLFQEFSTGRLLLSLLYLFFWVAKLIEFTLDRPYGVVIDAVTKKPLDFTVVQLVTASGTNQTLVHSTISDEHGRFLFTVRPDNYRVIATKEGYQPAEAAVMGDKLNLSLTMKPITKHQSEELSVKGLDNILR